MTALQGRYDYERTLIERDKQAALEKLDEEEKGRLKSIEGFKNEQELKFQIEELYKQKRLLSEEDFQEKLNELKKVYDPQIQEEAGNDGFGGLITKALGGIFGDEARAGITDGAEYIKAVYADLSDFAAGAIGSMVSGLGQLVQQWAVTGKFSGRAALQMASGIIAGLAVQAGIKAIFELAEGYAALASFNFPGAALHFAAAKIYGVVAGASLAVAVGVGALSRIGANNKNAQSAFSSAAGTGSSGGSSSTAGGDASTVLDIGRNPPSAANSAQGLFRQEVVVRLKVESDDSHIVEVFKEKVGRAGSLRDLIIDVATAA